MIPLPPPPAPAEVRFYEPPTHCLLSFRFGTPEWDSCVKRHDAFVRSPRYQAMQAGFRESWLKERASSYCISSKRIWIQTERNFPFPSKPAQSADEIFAFVLPCTAEVEKQADENLASWARLEVGSMTGGGGPIRVRAHTRCNVSKCWSVRSYTRRR